MVLLKNDQGVLPLKPQIRSIAVLGPLADDRDAPSATGAATAGSRMW